MGSSLFLFRWYFAHRKFYSTLTFLMLSQVCKFNSQESTWNPRWRDLPLKPRWFPGQAPCAPDMHSTVPCRSYSISSCASGWVRRLFQELNHPKALWACWGVTKDTAGNLPSKGCARKLLDKMSNQLHYMWNWFGVIGLYHCVVEKNSVLHLCQQKKEPVCHGCRIREESRYTCFSAQNLPSLIQGGSLTWIFLPLHPHKARKTDKHQPI